jgi:hypothetical protein
MHTCILNGNETGNSLYVWAVEKTVRHALAFTPQQSQQLILHPYQMESQF